MARTDDAAYAANWRQVLVADSAVGAVGVAVGVLVLAVGPVVIGGGILAVAGLYLTALVGRWRRWRRLRAEAGL